MSNQSKNFYTYADFQQAAKYIQNNIRHRPDIGLILGSGLSPLADEIEAADSIPYQDIPHFPHSGIAGHAGKLVTGQLAGKNVLVMQGRSHFYEGSACNTLPCPSELCSLWT